MCELVGCVGIVDSTILAKVWFFGNSHVTTLHVVDQASFVSDLQTTNVAVKLFLPMDNFVGIQLVGGGKRFYAHLTHVVFDL